MTSTYHAQHGEDLLIQRAIGSTAKYFYYVEVGMIDGLRFSNTAALERQGWTGLCVEAHPDYVEQVRQNRPNSTVIHAAASDACGDALTFYADPRGDLSTAVKPDVEKLKEEFGDWVWGFEEIQVPMRTLDDMLREADAPMGMEVVSIDVEGYELQVLRGFDLNRWQPRLIVLETDKDGGSDTVFKHLAEHGYTPARSFGVNTVFTRTRMDAWRVRLVQIDQPVLHTAHPTDPKAPEQRVYPSTYETNGDYLRRLAGHLLSAA